MAEIINLRSARKAQRRRAALDAAAINRAKFGRNRADKAAGEAEGNRLTRIVDGARIGGDGPDA
ncbi:MAG: DUF4169 family protein [Pseudomonadota bacterium]